MAYTRMVGTARRYDLDWLRIVATYLLFPFHVAKTFDVLPIYHIKNRELSPYLDYFTLFVHQWHMPLFFVLAGWSAYASMARRGTGDFLKERVQRLLVPFLAGSLLLCPFLKYVELSSGISITATGAAALVGRYDQTFLEFLPSFYMRVDRFTWSHLWFLLYLFTFTLLYVPLFGALVERSDRLAHVSVARLYLPLVPLVLIQTSLRFVWPGVQNLYDDWANFAYYSLFFMLGFVLARAPAWEAVVSREWRRAAAIGLVAGTAMVAGWMARGGVIWPIELSVAAVLSALPLQTLSAITGYCLVVALLGFARRYLSFTSSAQEYLVESSLPVYVLHQLGIVLPGYFIIQLQAGIATKFTLLLLIAVVLTMAVYHFVVRPSAVLRVMLGMRTRGHGAASGRGGPVRGRAETEERAPC